MNPNCVCGLCGNRVSVDPSTHSYFESVDGVRVFYCSMACLKKAEVAAASCGDTFLFPHAHGEHNIRSISPEQFMKWEPHACN